MHAVGRQVDSVLPAERGALHARKQGSIKAACMTIDKVLLACLAASALAPAFDGDTFAAKFEALPQAVQQTAKVHMQDALPVSILSAKGEHGWDYQVNTRINGKYHDLVIDDQGKLIAVKDETDLAALPAAAKAAIEKQAAAAKIMTLEKVTEGSQITYGAVIKDNTQGTFVKVSVAPDGTLKK